MKHALFVALLCGAAASGGCHHLCKKNCGGACGDECCNCGNCRGGDCDGGCCLTGCLGGGCDDGCCEGGCGGGDCCNGNCGKRKGFLHRLKGRCCLADCCCCAGPVERRGLLDGCWLGCCCLSGHGCHGGGCHGGAGSANFQPAPGPSAGAAGYPYYTTRGPTDFLARDPRSIGPY